MRGRPDLWIARPPIDSALSFSSFMSDSNRRPLDHDMHDAVLKGRKAMKSIFRVALAVGGAWVVIESAKALSVF